MLLLIWSHNSVLTEPTIPTLLLGNFRIYWSKKEKYRTKGKGKVCIWAKWPIRPELIPVSVAWSDWEYFYSPLDGVLVYRKLTPSIIRLYPFVHLGGERHRESKVSSQEHNTMSPARARARTARSGDERTNHEATTSPTEQKALTKYLITGKGYTQLI